MKVVVTSGNPVKLAATEEAFRLVFHDQASQGDFDFTTAKVSSDVPDQPRGDEETLRGAMNRAGNGKLVEPDADYWVGLEGGITEFQGDMYNFAWMYIEDKDGLVGKAKTEAFLLPPKIADLINSGMELGDADDQVFGMSNSKQKSGSIGILTGDVITRTTYYTPAIVCALIPFRNKEYYSL